MKLDISLVITVYNEEENIKPLIKSINQNLSNFNFQVIFVDDGSTDRTKEVILTNIDERYMLVELSTNFGQTPAMAAGIQKAEGDYIITLDGDLQNDPSDIPMMLQKLKNENWDLVAGYRKDRQDQALFRKFPSKIANRLIRNLTGIYIRDYGCTLKVFRAELAQNLGLYGELHRFIPILAAVEGAKVTDVVVKHHARIHGKSKYGLGRTFKVMSDLLLMAFFKKYFKRPIHFFGPLGLLSFFIGSIISLYLLGIKVMGGEIWGRPILILGITLILAGIQFLTFGLIAELIMRIYYESQEKKPYKIRHVFKGNPKKSATISDENYAVV